MSSPYSYSRPPAYTWAHVTPRPLLPVFPPPIPHHSHLPALPSPARNPIFHQHVPFTLSTHIIPAAYLRSTTYTPAPASIPANLPKAEREALAENISKQLHDLRGGTLEPTASPQILWNCINRYVRQGLQPGKAKGLTLFFAHANGFPKEIWEPTLQYLLTSPAASAIDEIWLWESVQHGDGCLINGNKLGGVFDWADNTRDILNFLLYYLPTTVSSDPLPTHLVRLPQQESDFRQNNPFSQRTLFAIGHSYGGCTTSRAALTKPNLFSSLMLVDPVLGKPNGSLIWKSHRTDRLVAGALLRRDTWDSRDQAHTLLSKSPFFSSWHPDVLKIYLECGTYDYHHHNHDHNNNNNNNRSRRSVIKLKMPGIQEAVVFKEIHSELEVFEMLPALEERIELRWVVPGQQPGMLGPAHVTRERVWVRPANSSNVVIPKAGHLIPQEAPEELALDIQQFIQRRYPSMTDPESSSSTLRASL